MPIITPQAREICRAFRIWARATRRPLPVHFADVVHFNIIVFQSALADCCSPAEVVTLLRARRLMISSIKSGANAVRSRLRPVMADIQRPTE